MYDVSYKEACVCTHRYRAVTYPFREWYLRPAAESAEVCVCLCACARCPPSLWLLECAAATATLMIRHRTVLVTLIDNTSAALHGQLHHMLDHGMSVAQGVVWALSAADIEGETGLCYADGKVRRTRTTDTR